VQDVLPCCQEEDKKQGARREGVGVPLPVSSRIQESLPPPFFTGLLNVGRLRMQGRGVGKGHSLVPFSPRCLFCRCHTLIFGLFRTTPARLGRETGGLPLLLERDRSRLLWVAGFQKWLFLEGRLGNRSHKGVFSLQLLERALGEGAACSFKRGG
jgi:hypothetical protein